MDKKSVATGTREGKLAALRDRLAHELLPDGERMELEDEIKRLSREGAA